MSNEEVLHTLRNPKLDPYNRTLIRVIPRTPPFLWGKEVLAHCKGYNRRILNSQLHYQYFKKQCINLVYNHFEYVSLHTELQYKYFKNVRGAYDKFPDFFRMSTFIDSTHMKL